MHPLEHTFDDISYNNWGVPQSYFPLGLGRMNVVLQFDIPEDEVARYSSGDTRDVWKTLYGRALDIGKHLSGVYIIEPADAAPVDTTKVLSPTLKTVYKYMHTAMAPAGVLVTQCWQTSEAERVTCGAPMTVKRRVPVDKVADTGTSLHTG